MKKSSVMHQLAYPVGIPEGLPAAPWHETRRPPGKGRAYIPTTDYHKTCLTLASALYTGCQPSVLIILAGRAVIRWPAPGDRESSVEGKRFPGGNGADPGAGPGWRY